MQNPTDNLYFQDLPIGFTDEQLNQILGAYGTIKQSKLLVREGMKPHALVRYASVDEAKWIVENLNGNIPQGLTDPVQIRYAESKSAGMKGAKGGGGYSSWDGGGWGGDDAWGKGGGMAGPYGGGCKGKGKGKNGGIRTLVNGLADAGALPGGTKYENDENALFIGGLPFDTTDLELYQIFAPFGAIAPRGCKAMVNPQTGMCSSIGFVNYMDHTVAQTAIATLNGTMLPDGSFLTVKPKGPPKEKGAGKGKDDGMFGSP